MSAKEPLALLPVLRKTGMVLYSRCYWLPCEPGNWEVFMRNLRSVTSDIKFL